MPRSDRFYFKPTGEDNKHRQMEDILASDFPLTEPTKTSMEGIWGVGCNQGCSFLGSSLGCSTQLQPSFNSTPGMVAKRVVVKKNVFLCGHPVNMNRTPKKKTCQEQRSKTKVVEKKKEFDALYVHFL